MAQSYPNIAATDLVSASRQNILARDDAVKSSFAGTTYPTTDLLIGMICYRTDLQKVYVLESTGPSVWREIAFAQGLGTAAYKNTGTSGDAVPLLNAANTWAALQTFAAGFNFGAQSLVGNAGSIQADADLRLNAAALKDINFLINSASKMKVNADGGITVGAVTGGSKGDGTLNVQAIYLNGTLLAFDLLSPMTTIGDIIYAGASGAAARLAGNTANNKKVLVSQGTGSAATAPTWGLTVGTAANNLVQLDASAKLPAVDGSQLTNLPASGFFTEEFDSGLQTWSIGTNQQIAHGLSGTPKLVIFEYVELSTGIVKNFDWAFAANTGGHYAWYDATYVGWNMWINSYGNMGLGGSTSTHRIRVRAWR